MITYKDAGVDVHAGYAAVDIMKRHAQLTHNPAVLTGLGSFGAMFQLNLDGIATPVLVSGTDGVGTKLKVAFALDKHDTIGIDCVAMCANDVVCQGATPLFFLDYLATGKLKPEQAGEIVGGVARGCLDAGCALIGGETAEMPGFYPEGEYDLAGFCVGIADKDKIIDGTRAEVGNAIIGLAGSGLHSNGYSLNRKLLVQDGVDLHKIVPELGESLADVLLCPTRIYVKSMLTLINEFDVRGVAHVTGGGFIENLPRMLPKNVCARINRGAWPIPPIFAMLQRLGQIPEESMYNTYNMGVGMAFIVPQAQAAAAISRAEALGEKAYIIGEVAPGAGLELK